MTDWLAFSRQVVDDLDAVLAEHPTRLEREPVVGAGEGGDETTAIDADAELLASRSSLRAAPSSRSSRKSSGSARSEPRLRVSCSTPSTEA